MSTLRQLVLAAVSTALCWGTALATPGDLDPSFGSGGIVVRNLGSYESAYTSDLQPDGKIVIGGLTGSPPRALVMRFDAAGALDPSFATGGVFTLSIGSDENEVISLKVDAAGRIVCAGRSYVPLPEFPDSSIAVFTLFRLLPGGTLDPSFGSGGIVVTDVSGSPSAVAIQADGKIVMTGLGYAAGPSNDVTLTRHDENGVPDPTFGTNGVVYKDVSGYTDWPFAIALAPDGGIAVAGLSFNGVDDDVLLARFDASGLPDAGFGTGGAELLSIGSSDEHGFGLVRQPDGKLVVAGSVGDIDGHQFLLMRVDASGALDPSFGTGGVATPVLGDDDEAYTLVRQPDGKLVAAGNSYSSSVGQRLGVARLDADGTLDASFGSGGVVTTDVPDATYEAENSLLLQPDGKLVLAGSVTTFTDDVMLARYDAGAICDADDQCIACERCTGVCEPGPRTVCKAPIAPGKAKLLLKRSSDPARSILKWTWAKGAATTLAELGNPLATDDYTLCVFDGDGAELRLAADVPAGGTCGTSPCWQAGSTDVRYRDRTLAADGVQALRAKSGASGVAKVTLKAKGSGVPMPVLPLALPVDVQLQVANGTCFGAHYVPTGSSSNSVTTFAGKSE